MVALPRFEPFRDAGFKSLLMSAFKAFPKKVEEVLAQDGWLKFVDFMAAVERSGRVLFQFEGKPSAKTMEKYGVEGAIEQMRAISNTNAMNQLLSSAFFGIQEGNPDRTRSSRALFGEGVTSWHTFSMTVLELALLEFAAQTGGKTPMDGAKPDTLLFYGLPDARTPEIMTKLAKAFGLVTPAHLIALSASFWSGDLTMENLDDSISNPELLTELVNRCPSNPHKGIVFSSVDNLS